MMTKKHLIGAVAVVMLAALYSQAYRVWFGSAQAQTLQVQQQPQKQRVIDQLPAWQQRETEELRHKYGITTSPDAFAKIAIILGCGHKISDDAAADVFAIFFQDQPILATGEVTRINQGVVSLKTLPTTLAVDVMIKMADPKVAYSLQNGQRPVIRFTLRQHGGCFLPFSGDDGQIVKVLR
jgi:hypothetical protein